MQMARRPRWYPMLSLITGTHGHGPFWAIVVAFDMRVQRAGHAVPSGEDNLLRGILCQFWKVGAFSTPSSPTSPSPAQYGNRKALYVEFWKPQTLNPCP